jgi:two-component system LytT family sensor kinase
VHPLLFIGASVLLGLLFALQDWNYMRLFNNHVSLVILIQGWGVQYLLWGILCWLFWWWLGPRFQHASFVYTLTRGLPLSILASFLEEMIWVACFPNMPWNRPQLTYWGRFAFHANAELISNMAIFWCAFGLFRGLTYYQKFREKESAATQLKTELVNSQIRALRMQLNPHFLFNTMNSISSLMQTDIAAADNMLEQLSSLLRITLERGEVQLIPLSDEIEFIEMYLAMQDRRFGGRVHQEISVEPDLHDALVPAMLLQPIIENAYTHGLSKLDKDGRLVVRATRRKAILKISVTNSGTGLSYGPTTANPRQGVGLANVQDRLRLHYGIDQSITLVQLLNGDVEARITLPLQITDRPTVSLTGDSTS